MEHTYPYLIIGGGMAADAAVRGIRQFDPQGEVGLIGEEQDAPYNRPPLTKGLWKRVRPTTLARIWRNTASLGVDLHLGRKAIQIEPTEKLVTDNQGDTYHYEKLLLATGGSPIQPWGAHERIIYFRTLADYLHLRTLTETGGRFIVIGGGFIGSEIAAALAGQGKDVVMIFPEDGIGARVLPREISQHLNNTFRGRGIRVLDGQLVQSVLPDDAGVTVITDQGESYRADGVIAGLGIRPNVRLAQDAGLATGDGIIVDASLRTSCQNIFAAGDVANFYSPLLEKRMRAEHEENANLTGMLAGQAMAGMPGIYDTLSSVYSTLFEINYDAVGELDPRLEIVYDWQEPLQKGTAFYMKDGRVRGVLLWNIMRGLDSARELISSTGPFRAEDLKNRIPNSAG